MYVHMHMYVHMYVCIYRTIYIYAYLCTYVYDKVSKTFHSRNLAKMKKLRIDICKVTISILRKSYPYATVGENTETSAFSLFHWSQKTSPARNDNLEHVAMSCRSQRKGFNGYPMLHRVSRMGTWCWVNDGENAHL